jgi:type I restriction enzyme M protein
VARVTKKDRPLTATHLAAFETCFGADPNGRSRRDPRDSFDGRWRSFPISEVQSRDFKIDGLKWLKDESLDDGDELLYPEDLAQDAIAELEGAVGELNEILRLLEGDPEVVEAPLVLRRAE